MSRYTLPCPSDYCPGCNRSRCTCPPPGWEEAQSEAAYERGYEAGAEFGPEDGPDNRPDPSWLGAWINPNREDYPESYLAGFDDAVAGRPNAVLDYYERRAKSWTMAPDGDDGLPF